MSNFKIVFVHGYTASSKADWYPTIIPELNKLDIDFAIPDLPGDEHPHADEWLKTIHNEVIKTNKPLILVGHSLGTRAVLLYLEKYKPKLKLALLIAAFSNNIANAERNGGKTYPDFFTHEIEMNNIIPFSNKFIVMHSENDSSIPYEQGVDIAKDLNAKLISFNGRDHLCDPENATFILDVLKKDLLTN